MVHPHNVPDIVLDAARLIQSGELVVFGSASLAFWTPDGAPSARAVDLWCDPAERGEVVEALMGELSWYHDKHGAYVEVWGPETFVAPPDWRTRARVLHEASVPGVSLVVAHPHDVLVAKLARWSPSDQAHAATILQAFAWSGPSLVRAAAAAASVATDEAAVRLRTHAATLAASMDPTG